MKSKVDETKAILFIGLIAFIVLIFLATLTGLDSSLPAQTANQCRSARQNVPWQRVQFPPGYEITLQDIEDGRSYRDDIVTDSDLTICGSYEYKESDYNHDANGKRTDQKLDIVVAQRRAARKAYDKARSEMNTDCKNLLVYSHPLDDAPAIDIPLSDGVTHDGFACPQTNCKLDLNTAPVCRVDSTTVEPHNVDDFGDYTHSTSQVGDSFTVTSCAEFTGECKCWAKCVPKNTPTPT